MTLLQLNVSAAVQAVIVSVTILSLAIVYFDRLSKISANLGKMAGSVDEIEDEVSSVELQQMERTLTKAFTKIDYIVDQQSVHSNGQTSMHTGDGTVYTKLDDTDIKVGVSYVTTHPQSKGQYHDLETGEVDNEDYDGPETVVEIEFDDEINMRGLFDKLGSDSEIVEREIEYIGREVGAKPTSPFEIMLHIPSDEYESISNFIPIYLDRIDEHIHNVRAEKDEIEGLIKEKF